MAVALAQVSNETAQEVLLLPISDVSPADDNPRGDVGDVAELAQSIASVGILQPLVVVHADEPLTYKVVNGHRRLAAAKHAGLTAVPCIVRDFDEQERVLAMAIENLQREDLTVLEEARAYRRLVDELGISQRELAERVGRAQSHISKRLALLELPKPVQAKVDSGGIDVTDALELTKLTDHPKRLADAAKARNVGWIVECHLAEIRAEEKFQAEKAKLKAAGIKMLSPAKDRYGSYGLPKGAIAIEKDGGYEKLKLDPAKHASEPCHAAVLFPRSNYNVSPHVVYVCTDRKRHPNLKTQAEGYRGRNSSASPAARKEAQELKAAGEQRRTFVGEFLKKGKLPKAEATELIVDAFLERQTHDALVRALKLLGLEPAEHDKNSKDYRGPIHEYAQKGPTQLMQVGLALAFGWNECDIEFAYSRDWSRRAPYFELLERHGYELSAIEKKRAKLTKGKS